VETKRERDYHGRDINSKITSQTVTDKDMDPDKDKDKDRGTDMDMEIGLGQRHQAF
jgi:hypothetical protein